MSETKAEALAREMSAACMEAIRVHVEAQLQAAWEKGHELGRAEGAGEGELRGRKQGVIRVAVNLLRTGMDPAVIAKAAELPEPIIRKLAQDNGIVLP